MGSAIEHRGLTEFEKRGKMIVDQPIRKDHANATQD